VRRFGRSPPLDWFAVNPDQQTLREYRLRGASTCGVREGRLHLSHGGAEHDLGLMSAMPLSMGGIAAYNVANMAGAAPAAVARAERRRLGFPDSALPVGNSEVDAARYALDWARPGDVLALPVHSSSARATVVAMLENM
jgi:hypothetical protein